MSHPAIEQSQQWDVLRKEKEQLLQALSTVNTKMNELVPVSMLSVEILESIFTICAQWIIPEFGERLQHRLAWAQVCRHWRYIALGSTRLWTSIDLSKPVQMREYLKRAGTAPLQLVVSSGDSPKEQEYPNELQLAANRIKSLEINSSSLALSKLFETLGQDFSCLSNLHLSASSIHSSNLAPPPHLKRLTLSRVSIPWNRYTGLSELTHFTLYNFQEFSPSLAELSMIFEGSPRIESIKLVDIDPAVDPSPKCNIKLPYLSEVHLNCKAHVVLAILECVTLLPQSQLHIFHSSRLSLSDLLSDLLSPHSVLTDRISQSRAIRLDLEGLQVLEPATTQLLDGRSFSFDILLEGISQLLEFPNVTNFEMGGLAYQRTGSSAPSWKEVFRILYHMPNLETLRLEFYHPIEPILSVLIDAGYASVYTLYFHNSIICPQLRHISFGKPNDNFRFKRKYQGPLIKLAKVRRKTTTPLETLEFNRPEFMPPEFLDKLRGLVDVIIKT